MREEACLSYRPFLSWSVWRQLVLQKCWRKRKTREASQEMRLLRTAVLCIWKGLVKSPKDKIVHLLVLMWWMLCRCFCKMMGLQALFCWGWTLSYMHWSWKGVSLKKDVVFVLFPEHGCLCAQYSGRRGYSSPRLDISALGWSACLAPQAGKSNILVCRQKDSCAFWVLSQWKIILSSNYSSCQMWSCFSVWMHD